MVQNLPLNYYTPNYIYSNITRFLNTLDNLFSLQNRTNAINVREQYTLVGMQRHFSDVFIIACVKLNLKTSLKSF